MRFAAEVLRELIPDAVNDAIAEHELAAARRAGRSISTIPKALDKFGEEPISFNVNVEVLPED